MSGSWFSWRQEPQEPIVEALRNNPDLVKKIKQIVAYQKDIADKMNDFVEIVEQYCEKICRFNL